ncbi:MAG: acyl-CoA thioesterase [Acetobacteraceae bacterium]
MQMIECYRGVVHPWLCDAMGHMTTRHYVGMFDDAGYHLLAALGFTASHLANGIGFADVRHVISYGSELRVGELVLIRCGVKRVGETSLTGFYRMEALETGATAAEMEVVMVQFDLNRRASMPIVPEIRAKAEALVAAA